MLNNVVFVALIVFLTSQINRLLPLNQLKDMPKEATLGVLRWGLILGSLVAGLFLFIGWSLLNAFFENQNLLKQILVGAATAIFLEKIWWLLHTTKKWPSLPPTWGSLIFSTFAILVIVLLPFLTWQEVAFGVSLGIGFVICMIVFDAFGLLTSKQYRWWEVLSSIPLMILAIKVL